MDSTSHLPDDEEPSRVLSSLLAFVALCIERPYEAASLAALALTLTALAITLASIVIGGSLMGVGLAAFYAASAWGLSLYLRKKVGGDEL